MSQPLTFAVTCFGRPERLRRCLESIRAHHPDAYIVVADNSVTPLNKAEAGLCDAVKYVRVEKVGNLPAARNAALREVKTPWFVLIEDDMQLTSSKATSVLYRQCQLQRADIVGGRVTKPGDVKWDWAGTFKREYDGLRILPALPEKGMQPVDLLPNFFVGRTSFFRRLPWDEQFPIAGEHLDYFLNAKLANAKILWHPGVEVLHDRGGDAEYQKFRQRRFYNELLNKWGVKWVRLPSMYRHEWEGNRVIGRRVTESTAVVVWTAGRSGSSAIGQILHRLGAPMGDCLLVPHDREHDVNRDGYYEDHSLCLAGWALGTNRVQREVVAEEIRDHCHRMANREAMFGLKAPGLSHDPQLVLRAIKGAGIKRVLHVWARRNEAQMLASLGAAGWMANEAAVTERMQNRCRNIETLFESLSDTDRLVVDYESLLINPVAETLRLAKLLGVTDKARIAAAASTIKPELQHF